MKALSVRQPWARLLSEGRKTIELRSWKTNYRGPLLICAALRPHAAGVETWGDGLRGCALAIVDLIDVRTAIPADADAACVVPEPNSFAWVVANARPVTPFPISGRLSLFEVNLPTDAPPVSDP